MYVSCSSTKEVNLHFSNENAICVKLGIWVGGGARGQNTFYGYEGYFEQILAKIAPIVHFTIDQYLLAGAIL